MRLKIYGQDAGRVIDIILTVPIIAWISDGAMGKGFIGRDVFSLKFREGFNRENRYPVRLNGLFPPQPNPVIPESDP